MKVLNITYLLIIFVMLVQAKGDVIIHGAFTENGAYPGSSITDESVKKWASWSGSDANTGRLETLWFICPETLAFYISGYPRKEGNKILLEIRKDEETIKQVELKANQNPREAWMLQSWNTNAYSGNKVRVILIDNTTNSQGWLGMSERVDHQIPLLSSKDWFTYLQMFFALCFHWIILLYPGVAIIALYEWRGWCLGRQLTVLFVFLGLFAYGSFFLFRINPELGLFAVSIIYLILAVVIGRRWGDVLQLITTRGWYFLIPLCLAFLNFSILALYGLPNRIDKKEQNRFLDGLTPDNIIPT